MVKGVSLSHQFLPLSFFALKEFRSSSFKNKLKLLRLSLKLLSSPLLLVNCKHLLSSFYLIFKPKDTTHQGALSALMKQVEVLKLPISVSSRCLQHWLEVLVKWELSDYSAKSFHLPPKQFSFTSLKTLGRKHDIYFFTEFSDLIIYPRPCTCSYWDSRADLAQHCWGNKWQSIQNRHSTTQIYLWNPVWNFLNGFRLILNCNCS